MTNGAVHDVLGIGNAIVDVLSSAEEEFLDRHGLRKGTMRLVDEETSRSLYGEMGPGVEMSGGSAANTLVGVASLGGRAAFIGKVRDDQLGEVFGHDLRAAGVSFRTPAATSGPSTARCLILVTPDGERTMSTYLGACADLDPDDVDAELIGGAAITYLEGYLFDPPAAKDAFRTASALAHEAGNRVAFTLSDLFCVERYREEFDSLIENGVDILLANEGELTALYGTAHPDTALDIARKRCDVVVCTRGAQGSWIADADTVHEVPVAPVERVVDTTGAGDLYAAGVLYGLTHGLELDACGRLGALCASEVISHVGARPQVDLRDLAREAGLL